MGLIEFVPVEGSAHPNIIVNEILVIGIVHYLLDNIHGNGRAFPYRHKAIKGYLKMIRIFLLGVIGAFHVGSTKAHKAVSHKGRCLEEVTEEPFGLVHQSVNFLARGFLPLAFEKAYIQARMEG